MYVRCICEDCWRYVAQKRDMQHFSAFSTWFCNFLIPLPPDYFKSSEIKSDVVLGTLKATLLRELFFVVWKADLEGGRREDYSSSWYCIMSNICLDTRCFFDVTYIALYFKIETSIYAWHMLNSYEWSYFNCHSKWSLFLPITWTCACTTASRVQIPAAHQETGLITKEPLTATPVHWCWMAVFINVSKYE